MTSFPVEELLSTPAAAAETSKRGNAIELRGVTKSFADMVALHPLDLDIRDGEFFCLLGPSGCGKTTTLNIIGGFTAPSSGVVRIAGEDMTKRPPNRRPVNTVFQSYALFPHLNVVENVSFGMRMARVPKSEQRTRASEALDLVGLGTFAQRPVSQLSGGQAQRVAIARALVNKPSVLLLDEPLGALDLKLRKRLQTELSLIQRHVGTTFVFVTHDQEEAMALADRIVILNEGRIEQIGTPEEIYRRPASLFAADFIGESNILHGKKDGERFRTGKRCEGSDLRTSAGSLHLAGGPAGSPADRQGRIHRCTSALAWISRVDYSHCASAGEFRNAGRVVVERRRH